MPTWPASLPQVSLLDGLAVSGTATLQRTTMESGEAKVRPRTTAKVRPVQLAFLMTEAQRTTFLNFVDTTLAGGALRFDLPALRGGAGVVTVRMTGGAGQPTHSETAVGRYWRIAFEVEILPT